MKHLLCEHQNTVSELKEDRLVAADARRKEQDELEDELFNKMRAIKVEMQESGIGNRIKELELVCPTQCVVFFFKFIDKLNQKSKSDTNGCF